MTIPEEAVKAKGFTLVVTSVVVINPAEHDVARLLFDLTSAIFLCVRETANDEGVAAEAINGFDMASWDCVRGFGSSKTNCAASKLAIALEVPCLEPNTVEGNEILFNSPDDKKIEEAVASNGFSPLASVESEAESRFPSLDNSL